jgi:peptidoglycan/LPS O-acetylase OafA/YrhL
VVLFFCLSGFLISWPFWKRKFAQAGEVVPTGYASRRFWKIYPPMALSILLLTPIYILISHDGSFLEMAAKWLTGFSFLLPVSGKLNPVLWTLVIEVQFYAVLPLVFLAFNKLPAKACLWVIPIVFLMIPVCFRYWTGLSPAHSPEINTHFPSGLDAFFLGILLAGLENAGLVKRSWANLGFMGLVLWATALVLNGWGQVHSQSLNPANAAVLDWTEKIGSSCLLCYIANPRHPFALALCAPWLRWCGIISYEWYLFHQPAVLWARQAFGAANGAWPKYLSIIVGSAAISLILSASVYRFFSLPILRYGRSSIIKK